jgi:MbtH protein
MTTANQGNVDAYTIDGDLLKVIVNAEGQYSIWPAKKETPAGWKETGFTGTKAECSQYVDQEWTDLRPISLQVAMQGTQH